MKVLTAFCLLTIIVVQSCSSGQDLEEKDGFAVMAEPDVNESAATFAGGCFWAMQEAMLQLKGVNKVISGYAGGTKENPTYEEVLSKNTGHAEAVQVYYNPKIITFRQLTKAFFYAHDPTQLNRQGPDIGSDYRSAVFYRTAQEYMTVDEVIDELNRKNVYKGEIVTELTPFEVIYPAEMEHQDYYKKNPFSPYIRKISRPKVLKVRKAMPELIKNEYLD